MHTKTASVRDVRARTRPVLEQGADRALEDFKPRYSISVSRLVLDWQMWQTYVLLAGLTLLCLIPFSGKAFHIDDTLFVLTAKQIVKHPLDPYGFQVVWERHLERMADVTKNPPLACYYSAFVGAVAGWSERTLHLAFLFPAIALVLGTYRLARHFTEWGLLAAFATLFTPAVLVSATSVMCDTLMVALWVWAMVLWLEGLEATKPLYLLSSSIIIAAAALSKYFGVVLIPLLLVYSLIRLRHIGWWAAYFLIPIIALVGYELWTMQVYGESLIAEAAKYAAVQREVQQGSLGAHVIVSISFIGGCALSSLTLLPLAWSRKQVLVGVFVAGLACSALAFDWVDYGLRVGGDVAAQSLQGNWPTDFQLVLCIFSGLTVLAAAIAGVWEHRDADSWLLALWVIGTWTFAGFLNWTVNARSVLPLIPAAGILLARRVRASGHILKSRARTATLACGLATAAILSLWITAADVALANSAREAATSIYQKTRGEHDPVYFLGHWGFQYYMETLGFIPGDQEHSDLRSGSLVIIPTNNAQSAAIIPSKSAIVAKDRLQLSLDQHVTTMNWELGAGFYSSYWGPMPFAFGNVPPEIYLFGRVVPEDEVQRLTRPETE